MPRFQGQQPLLGRDSRKPSVGRTKISRLFSHPLPSFHSEPSRPRLCVAARGSWTPPSRGGCATSRGATDARGVPRAGVLFVASSRLGGRPRRSARDGRLASRRGPPVRPRASVVVFARGDYGARVRPRGAPRGDAVRRDRAGHIRAGGHVLPLRLRRRSILRVRARATATTPSLVDSETHETRPSAPLRVAAPDPWASSAPSAASASSDTPPP